MLTKVKLIPYTLPWDLLMVYVMILSQLYLFKGPRPRYCMCVGSIAGRSGPWLVQEAWVQAFWVFSATEAFFNGALPLLPHPSVARWWRDYQITLKLKIKEALKQLDTGHLMTIGSIESLSQSSRIMLEVCWKMGPWSQMWWISVAECNSGIVGIVTVRRG